GMCAGVLPFAESAATCAEASGYESMDNACPHDDYQRLVDPGFGDDGGLILRDIDIRHHIAVAFGLRARRLRSGWHVKPDAQSIQANHLAFRVGTDSRRSELNAR